MADEIANEDFQVTITPLGAWTPGSPVYTPQLADNAKLDGKRIVKEKIEWEITTGCQNPQGSGGGGSAISGNPIVATATKVKCDGKAVVRNGDIGSCKGSQSTSGSPLTCTCDFKITDAGQNKVRGE